MYGWEWQPYVSVAERRAKAAKTAAKMVKNGEKVSPVKLEGRALANTFWGKAWCAHLESFSDYSNRLPRGRSYVRNGSVIHLSVEKGKVSALVQGSSLYKVQVDIGPVDEKKWQSILRNCSGQIDSVIELLQGKLSSGVMKTITDKENGLFPLPKEISLNCSCPDWAKMCKHVAAVLYGVGARLDVAPELLFTLRKADHLELINNASLQAPAKHGGKAGIIRGQDLSDLFGIDIAPDAVPPPKVKKTPAVPSPGKSTAKKPPKKTVRKPVGKTISRNRKQKAVENRVVKKLKTSK